MKTITFDETKWKLVPVEPDERMVHAFMAADRPSLAQLVDKFGEWPVPEVSGQVTAPAEKSVAFRYRDEQVAKGMQGFYDALRPQGPQHTGWPGGMLQDDSRDLSKALASKPDARLHAREAAAAITAERVPLSDDQIADIELSVNGCNVRASMVRHIVRLVEAAHGIRGKS